MFRLFLSTDHSRFLPTRSKQLTIWISFCAIGVGSSAAVNATLEATVASYDARRNKLVLAYKSDGAEKKKTLTTLPRTRGLEHLRPSQRVIVTYRIANDQILLVRPALGEKQAPPKGAPAAKGIDRDPEAEQFPLKRPLFPIDDEGSEDAPGIMKKGDADLDGKDAKVLDEKDQPVADKGKDAQEQKLLCVRCRDTGYMRCPDKCRYGKISIRRNAVAGSDGRSKLIVSESAKADCPRCYGEGKVRCQECKYLQTFETPHERARRQKEDESYRTWKTFVAEQTKNNPLRTKELRETESVVVALAREHLTNGRILQQSRRADEIFRNTSRQVKVDLAKLRDIAPDYPVQVPTGKRTFVKVRVQEFLKPMFINDP